MYRVFRETNKRRVHGMEGLVSTHRGAEDAFNAAKVLAEEKRGQRFFVKDSRNQEIFSVRYNPL